MTRNAGQACIAVENDGQPISPAHVAQIFERFAQGEESKGAGLGLSIVQEIVAAHQGEVSLVTKPLTRFEIRLKTSAAPKL